MVEREAFHGEMRKYRLVERHNFAETVKCIRPVWDLFEMLDEIWFTGLQHFEKASSDHQSLVFLLFAQAHSQFRSAFPIGFSGRIAVAQNVLRTGIELVAHGHRIHSVPDLARVWFEKDEGGQKKKAFREAFEHFKEERLFSATRALKDLYNYWKKFSEWGTHSTVSALASRAERVRIEEQSIAKLHYFETRPKVLARLLFDLLTASRLLEEVFFDVFQARLQLDYQLVSRRRDFRVRFSEVERTVEEFASK